MIDFKSSMFEHQNESELKCAPDHRPRVPVGPRGDPGARVFLPEVVLPHVQADQHQPRRQDRHLLSSLTLCHHQGGVSNLTKAPNND